MGTTTTAAYVDDDEVVIAHVGDSRAYLLRNGELIRLTKDHSLVGELVARGKLTEEQAEQHPQRSVITRALGPEASVQVDIDIFPAKAGDLFLLCSDGLTSMVHEPKLRPLFEEADSLEELGKRLIDAANAAGGRDNITVILFRLEEVEGARRRRGRRGRDGAGRGRDLRVRHVRGRGRALAAPGRHARRRGRAAGRRGGRRGRGGLPPRRHRRAVGDPPAGRVRARRDPRGAAAAGRCGQVRDGDSPAAPHRPPPGAAAKPRKRRKRRVPAGLIVGLVLLAMILAGAWIATRAVYFVGTDPRDDRTITIFRGLPYDLPFGIELYERFAGSGVTIDDVPRARRSTFTDHKLRSRDDAENLVIALERGQIE